MVRRLAALGLFASIVMAAPAAARTCTAVRGPDADRTTASITIGAPEHGSVIAVPGCTGSTDVQGTWLLAGSSVDYDFYVVIDNSGSTRLTSAADVNGNGVMDEAADNILRAEIAAATAFVEGVPAERARFAIVRFSDSASVIQPLSDKAATLASLASLATLSPSGGTHYGNALARVESLVTANPERAARSQRCLFLSDGQPGDSQSSIEAVCRRLALLDVRIDTFALGLFDPPIMRSMAAIASGTCTILAVPGDIIAALPAFVPSTPTTFTAVQVTTSSSHPVEVRDDGTFVVRGVPLVSGRNVVSLTLTVSGAVTLSVECSVEVRLVQEGSVSAGPDLVACPGRPLLLRGSAAGLPCPDHAFRWVDCRGFPACPVSDDPTCEVVAGACDSYVLQASCGGAWCPLTDEVRVSLRGPLAPSPRQIAACGDVASVTCGLPPDASAGWDLLPARDTDGDGVADNDADVSGCDAEIAVTARRTVAAWSRTPAGCATSVPLSVGPDDRPVRRLDGGACPGARIVLACDESEAALVSEWDLDLAADSDGDGDGGNDADAAGCEVATTFPAGRRGVALWLTDAQGCRSLAAEGTIRVDSSAAPGEATGLRLAKDGGLLAFRWTRTPGADGWRVLRGSLDALRQQRLLQHAVADPAACGLGAPSHLGRDLGEPGDFTYLVTATNCAGEGITGFGWTPWVLPAIPPRVPSASCP